MISPQEDLPELPRPRIPPGTVADTGRLNRVIARVAGVALGTPYPNLFTTLARNRSIFRAWLRFAGRLMPAGALPRVDTELMILRTAHNCGSEYEWRAHEPLARRAGLNPEQIQQARHGPSAASLSAHQRLLLRAVDELHTERSISDDTWAGLRPRLTDAQLIELCMLVGHYEMLAMTLNSLRVQPDIPAAERMPALARVLQSVAGRRPPKSDG